MTLIVRGVMLLAAILFISISASMNAVFLSSFGRSALETTLLAGVSIAGDAVKAVLPVVIVRAISLRAWSETATAVLMLAVVVSLSLASGLGFAALTRGTAVATRENAQAMVIMRQADLLDLDRQIGAIGVARSAARVEAEIDMLKLEPLWTASKGCARANDSATRQFCSGLVALRGELATIHEHERLLMHRRELRASVETLRASVSESDPQAIALAQLLGTDPKTPRLVLMMAMAVVLELGSIVLVLLAAGSALRGPERATLELPPLKPATVPASAERTYWNRQRDAGSVPNHRSGHDAR